MGGEVDDLFFADLPVYFCFAVVHEWTKRGTACLARIYTPIYVGARRNARALSRSCC